MIPTYTEQRQEASNPWGLTAKQCKAMAALAEHGKTKKVARVLNTSHQSAANILLRCYRAMGMSSDVQAVLAWDRWVRSYAACGRFQACANCAGPTRSEARA